MALLFQHGVRFAKHVDALICHLQDESEAIRKQLVRGDETAEAVVYTKEGKEEEGQFSGERK